MLDPPGAPRAETQDGGRREREENEEAREPKQECKGLKVVLFGTVVVGHSILRSCKGVQVQGFRVKVLGGGFRVWVLGLQYFKKNTFRLDRAIKF